MDIVISGSGKVVTFAFLPQLKQLSECNVVALADPQVEFARQVAEQHNVPQVYPTLKEALENEKVDAVMVCSIPQNHLADVLTAFDYGCHVLLEKPIAMSIEEFKQMKAASEKAGKVLSVVHNWKFRPGIQTAFQVANSGGLGEVLNISAVWRVEAGTDRMSSDPEHWVHQLTGGRWAETLPHNIYIMYNILGKLTLKDVSAKLVSDKHPWLRADEVNVTLEHARGNAEINFSGNKQGMQDDYLIITGSKRIMICDTNRTGFLSYGDIAPMELVKGNLKLAKKLAGKVLGKVGLGPKGGGGGDPSGHGQVIRRFVSEVVRHTPPSTSFEEAFMTMELVEQIGKEIDRLTRIG